jgi:glycosyltransferase involved in cell wall biosynthesis
MISIVIPCYNSQESISRAIISVMNQTIIDQVEKILVVDDASSDGSVDAIRQIDCDKIQLITLPQNSGSAARPRNIAISSTNSEFIAFLDSDDYWLENHLELALSKIRDGYDLVSTNASISNFSTKTKKFFLIAFSRRITTMELLFHNPVIMSSVLCKSNIFNHAEISFADSSSKDFYNDYLLWLKLSTFRRLYFYNRETVNYTLSKNSDSSRYNNPLQADRKTLEIFFSWIKNFASKNYFLYVISYSILYWIKRIKIYLFLPLKRF